MKTYKVIAEGVTINGTAGQIGQKFRGEKVQNAQLSAWLHFGQVELVEDDGEIIKAANEERIKADAADKAAADKAAADKAAADKAAADKAAADKAAADKAAADKADGKGKGKGGDK